MAHLEPGMHPVLYDILLFFVAFSLVSQASYLLYHFTILVDIASTWTQAKPAKATEAKAREWFAAGYARTLSSYQIAWDMCLELIKLGLLLLALNGPRDMAVFCFFFPICLLRSWMGADELVEHLYEPSALEGTPEEATHHFTTAALRAKDWMHHLTFVAGALSFSHYFYMHMDSFFNYGVD